MFMMMLQTVEKWRRFFTGRLRCNKRCLGESAGETWSPTHGPQAPSWRWKSLRQSLGELENIGDGCIFSRRQQHPQIHGRIAPPTNHSNLWQPKWHCQDPSRQGANDICLNGLCLHGEQKLQSILPLLTSRVDQWLPKGGSPILCLYEYGLIWDDLGGDTGDTSILGNPQIAYQWCETAVYGKTMVIYGKLW